MTRCGPAVCRGRKSAMRRPWRRRALILQALPKLPDEVVIETLVAVPGIGRWTAEIYAMFALAGRMSSRRGDLALQEAARELFDLTARPKEREMAAIAAAWSPWRGVAARLLWSYYRVMKNREGIR